MRPLSIFLGVFLLIFMSSSCKDLFPDKAPTYLKAVLDNTNISDIKTTSALVSSKITTKGSATTEDYGFCYSEKEQPTTEDTKISLGASAAENQEITSTITDLLPNTKYFVRAYLKDATQTNYGSVTQFTTTNLQAPKVNIADATDVKFNSFSIIGQITDIGTSEVTEYGHALSESNKEPALTGIITKMGTASIAPKEFKSVFTTLKANTTYYVRSYATNATGTGFSEVKTIKTGALEMAKVTTMSIADISFNSANVSGKITEQGTNPITDFGHVISKTNQNPTIADTKTSLGVPSALPKDYVSSFSGLEISTTYYTRSYAVSDAGVAYGEVKSFKTLDKTPPLLTTKEVSNITYNSAIIGGNLSAQGSHAVTDFGHVISKTNQSATTTDTKTSLGATPVPKDFVSTFSGLEANTTYYVRAYAISEGGTGYGDVKTFKTLNLLPPTVSTISALSGSTTTGSADGKITSLGTSSTITDYGFCYSSTNQMPTIADTKKSLGSTSDGNLPFKSGISNLVPNTNYYLRAYATSSAGTGYGDVMSFKTFNYSAPLIGNVSISTPTYCKDYFYSWINDGIDYSKPFYYCSENERLPSKLSVEFKYSNINGEVIKNAGICISPAIASNLVIGDGPAPDPDINSPKIQVGDLTSIWDKNNNEFTGNLNHTIYTGKSTPCANYDGREKYYQNYYIKPYLTNVLVIDKTDPKAWSVTYKYRGFLVTESGKIYYGPVFTFNVLSTNTPPCRQVGPG